jgi:hypothetical protein
MSSHVRAKLDFQAEWESIQTDGFTVRLVGGQKLAFDGGLHLPRGRARAFRASMATMANALGLSDAYRRYLSWLRASHTSWTTANAYDFLLSEARKVFPKDDGEIIRRLLAPIPKDATTKILEYRGSLHYASMKQSVQVPRCAFHGFMPVEILADISAIAQAQGVSIPTIFADPGLYNAWAGVISVDPATATTVDAFRIHGDEVRMRLGPTSSRASPRARARRERLKATTWHELLGKLALTCTRLSHQHARADTPIRCPLVVLEDAFHGGGRSHAQLPLTEWSLFVAEFWCVGVAGGFATSRTCSRCNQKMRLWRNRPAGSRFRTYECVSRSCVKKDVDGVEHSFKVDRDTLAGMNLLRIFRAHMKGLPRPKPFRSPSYARRVRDTLARKEEGGKVSLLFLCMESFGEQLDEGEDDVVRGGAR